MKRTENQSTPIFVSMRQALLLFSTLLLMTGCGKSGERTDTSSSPTPNPTESAADEVFEQPHIDGDPQSDDYVIARVNAIYDNIFKENFPEHDLEDEEEFIPQDVPSPDEKFCTKDWNEWMSKVDEYDRTNSPDELGFLDFDYWVMGQDYGKLSITDVTLVKRDKEHSVVDFLLHNFDTKTHVRLELKFERGEWYIDNIIDLDNNFDMRKEMKEYLKG